jgi:hypothetical protein
MPIRSITRASAVVKGGKIQEQVVLSANSTLKLEISNLPSAPTAGILIFSADRFAVPLFGGTLVPNILAPNFILPIAGAGSINLSLPFPDFGPGVNFYWQAWVADANGPFGWTSTNAIRTVTQ